MPGIRDVAEKAGVSTATVSRVLAGKDNVRPEVDQRVLAAVEALGYRLNRGARSLRTRTAERTAREARVVAPPLYDSARIRAVRGQRLNPDIAELDLKAVILQENRAGLRQQRRRRERFKRHRHDREREWIDCRHLHGQHHTEQERDLGHGWSSSDRPDPLVYRPRAKGPARAGASGRCAPMANRSVCAVVSSKEGGAAFGATASHGCSPQSTIASHDPWASRTNP